MSAHEPFRRRPDVIQPRQLLLALILLIIIIIAFQVIFSAANDESNYTFSERLSCRDT